MPPQDTIRFNAISRAWELYKSQIGTWVLISLIQLIVYFVTQTITQLLVAIPTAPSMATPSNLDPFVVVFALPSLLGAMVINLTVNYIVQGAVMGAAIKQVRGQGLQLGALGEVTQVLGNLIVVALLQTVIVAIGLALCILPGIVAIALLMFSVPLVVDQRIRGVEAIRQSFEMLKSQWLMATLFFIVVSTLGFVGFLLCGVGLILTLPLYYLSVAVAYNDFAGGVPQA